MVATVSVTAAPTRAAAAAAAARVHLLLSSDTHSHSNAHQQRQDVPQPSARFCKACHLQTQACLGGTQMMVPQGVPQLHYTSDNLARVHGNIKPQRGP